MELGFNEIAKECLLANGYDYNKPVEERFVGFDFTKASYCASKLRTQFYVKDYEFTKAFLKANPQFRYPGGSNGNIDPCWGKTKLYHVEGGCR